MFTIIRTRRLKDIESRLEELESVSGRVSMKKMQWNYNHALRMIIDMQKELDKLKK